MASALDRCDGDRLIYIQSVIVKSCRKVVECARQSAFFRVRIWEISPLSWTGSGLTVKSECVISIYHKVLAHKPSLAVTRTWAFDHMSQREAMPIG